MNANSQRRKLHIALSIALASALAVSSASADIIVDPKGHDPQVLQQDQMECRELASGVEFDMAENHQGKSVIRGAAVGGGFAAIAGGNKEMRRRSAAAGALTGGLMKNKSKRVDGTVQEKKVMDAQRSCMAGRGYSTLN